MGKLIIVAGWISLMLWVATGSAAELPTSRKEWYVLAGITVVGVAAVVAVAMMWPGHASHFR
jgi:hypothetical protein